MKNTWAMSDGNFWTAAVTSARNWLFSACCLKLFASNSGWKKYFKCSAIQFELLLPRYIRSHRDIVGRCPICNCRSNLRPSKLLFLKDSLKNIKTSYGRYLQNLVVLLPRLRRDVSKECRSAKRLRIGQIWSSSSVRISLDWLTFVELGHAREESTVTVSARGKTVPLLTLADGQNSEQGDDSPPR